jgi:ubiquinone/menaquinone biosynthesis C-methylase UbiE
LPELHARGAGRMLDLGCGVGRHALLLAEHGFDVEALDGSLTGLAVVRETAAARGLPVSLHQGLADALPFPDAGFDYVLSWNVIHHATLGDLGRRLGEIWRVLRPAGRLQVTVLSTRDANYGIGRAIAPDTFVIDAADHAEGRARSTGSVVKLAGQAEDHLSRLRSNQQGLPYRKEGPGHFGRHVVSDRDLGDPERRDP